LSLAKGKTFATEKLNFLDLENLAKNSFYEKKSLGTS
jgi:hypothetical protein